MRNFIINIYLLIGAFQDSKTKKIKVWYLWLGGILGLFFKIKDFSGQQVTLSNWIIQMIPGVLFLIYAKLGKEKIGEGDGWLLLILGNCFPGMRVWTVFYLSVVLLALFSWVLIIKKKANKTTEIPFIPFLWTADTCLWGLQYVFRR